MLAPVKALDPTPLTDPESGVKTLLGALRSWDESAELQTDENCEKALFKIYQKADETTMSSVNRLSVAFHELGDQLTIRRCAPSSSCCGKVPSVPRTRGR